jgi:hypothetical protein
MRNAQTTTKPTAASAETLAGEMCALLEAMLTEHRAMVLVVERRKEALKRARINDLNSCIAEESVIAQRIAMLDQRRDAVVRELVPLLGGAPLGSPRGWRPNAEWLVPRIGGTLGERVRTVATALREVIESLRAANASTREAAETVARHIQGIVRSVEQRLSGSGAYTHRGVVSAAPSALCGVDVTS